MKIIAGAITCALVALEPCTAAEPGLNGGEPAIVKIVTKSSSKECDGYGIGFFASPDGTVMTAAHVVPESSTCEDLKIYGIAKGDSTPFRLIVSERSGLDVALLKPETPRRTPYLRLVLTIPDRDKFKDRLVVVPLFYPDWVEPSYTEARISAVRFVGDPNSQSWEIATLAANPGRSGSPVILDDASAVAVFVARPDTTGDKNSNRALIVPIAYLKDLHLPEGDEKFSLRPATDGQALKYAFPIQMTVAPKYEGRAYYFKDSQIIEGSADLGDIVRYAVQGFNVVRARQTVSQVFNAKDGYVFRGTGVEVRASSLNPTTTPLPSHVCTNAADTLCWMYSPDRKTLSIKFELYSGRLDGARGWFVGDVIAEIAPQ
jgi:hypothetical protein